MISLRLWSSKTPESFMAKTEKRLSKNIRRQVLSLETDLNYYHFNATRHVRDSFVN